MTELSNISGSAEIANYLSISGDESAPVAYSIEEAFAIGVTYVGSVEFYFNFVSTYEDYEIVTTYSELLTEQTTNLDTSDEGFPLNGIGTILTQDFFDAIDSAKIVGISVVSAVVI